MENKKFFDDDLFLSSPDSFRIYDAVKNLPIIDYHCHLDQKMIKNDSELGDIGELWLKSDHYKWRAMRLCGVDEKYITGDASYFEKFLEYASIMPKLAGGPLYYWTHLELRQIFGINEPLNSESARRIYENANEVAKKLSVSDLLKLYRVEYIATTDDPCDSLEDHGIYGGVRVAPTFRPDKVFLFDREYLDKLGRAAGCEIDSFVSLCNALESRIDYFVSHGCRVSDHGFAFFPDYYPDSDEAEELFSRRGKLNAGERSALFGALLTRLCRMYAKRGMIMQLHCSVMRNVNPEMFDVCGPDSGFDIIGPVQSVSSVVSFFSQIPDRERPETIIYTLNDSDLRMLSCLSGAFRHVKIGAAWWFNDTVEGIRKNLSVISEYSCLGTNYGMLTDSRSFSSYARFDFFRRLLSDYLGGLVDRGEYDAASAEKTAIDICYGNIKEALGL